MNMFQFRNEEWFISTSLILGHSKTRAYSCWLYICLQKSALRHISRVEHSNLHRTGEFSRADTNVGRDETERKATPPKNVTGHRCDSRKFYCEQTYSKVEKKVFAIEFSVQRHTPNSSLNVHTVMHRHAHTQRETDSEREANIREHLLCLCTRCFKHSLYMEFSTHDFVSFDSHGEWLCETKTRIDYLIVQTVSALCVRVRNFVCIFDCKILGNCHERVCDIARNEIV